MGKAGRILCIFTPMALTLASFVCMIFIEVGGWTPKSTTLNNMHFLQADFSNFSVSSADSEKALGAALTLVKSSGALKDTYQIHLWNYCTANEAAGTGNDTSANIDWCSKRKSEFVFDPIDVWALNATSAASAASDSSNSEEGNAISAAIANAGDDIDDFKDKLLGKSAVKALNTYEHVAKWNFIAYEIAFWTTLATLVVGILAIFSRWGSLLTWILSIVSTLFTFLASITITVLFSILTGALKGLLDDYHVKISLGSHALAVTWLATAFSLFATGFWLTSVCCCSGKSNPHHRSNKGGLWQAEPKGQGYGFAPEGRGRGLKVEKTGGYERVGSPVWGMDEQSDRVPLAEYPAQQHGYGQGMAPGGAYEPFRR